MAILRDVNIAKTMCTAPGLRRPASGPPPRALGGPATTPCRRATRAPSGSYSERFAGDVVRHLFELAQGARQQYGSAIQRRRPCDDLGNGATCTIDQVASSLRAWITTDCDAVWHFADWTSREVREWSRVGSRRGPASYDADVSSILPIIPYGGFSPVRLEGWLSKRGLSRQSVGLSLLPACAVCYPVCIRASCTSLSPR